MKDKYFVMDKEFVNDCITFVLTFKRLLERIETMDIDNAKTVDEVETPISISKVRLMLAEKCASGYKDAVKHLLYKYNAEKLSDVSKEKYPELIKDISLIGQKIL